MKAVSDWRLLFWAPLISANLDVPRSMVAQTLGKATGLALSAPSRQTIGSDPQC